MTTAEPVPSDASGAGATALDPFEPGYFADPYSRYARARAAGPVQRGALGSWMLLSHDVVLKVLRDPALSVEEHNATADPLREIRRAQLGEDGAERAEMRNRSMLDLDPPDHDRLRRLVAKAFNPTMVRALQPRIEELVQQSLDAMARAAATQT